MSRWQPFHHELDIYGADLWLATTPTQWRALTKACGAVQGEPPGAAGLSTFATFHPHDGGMTVPVCVLWIDVAQHKHPGDLVDTCAHEAAHTAGHLFDHVGQEYGGSNEAHAYLVGWLTRWIWERCT